jgi:RNA polymerase sigma-70 factor (ECF subfamily)
MTTGDERFAALYERYRRDVHAYCRRRASADRVDDAVAETFLVAWKKIDSLPWSAEVLPWLYGVAYRVLAAQWRGLSRRRRFEERFASLGASVPATPEEYVVTRHESRQVLDAAARLKPTDQEILRLSLWEELEHSEIAIALGINPDAARQRLSRSIRNLTKEFDRLESKKTYSPAAEKGGAW